MLAAQVIMATAQAFHEMGVRLREVYCNELKVVYTWVDRFGNTPQTGVFLYNRSADYAELVQAIKDNVDLGEGNDVSL